MQGRFRGLEGTCGIQRRLGISKPTRERLVQQICVQSTTRRCAGTQDRAEVMGRAFGEKLAKSDFIIDELEDDAYFIEAA